MQVDPAGAMSRVLVRDLRVKKKDKVREVAAVAGEHAAMQEPKTKNAKKKSVTVSYQTLKQSRILRYRTAMPHDVAFFSTHGHSIRVGGGVCEPYVTGI